MYCTICSVAYDDCHSSCISLEEICLAVVIIVCDINLAARKKLCKQWWFFKKNLGRGRGVEFAEYFRNSRVLVEHLSL